MAKNKSATTIRRRKGKPKQYELDRMRESCHSSPFTSDDESKDEEDDCYMFNDEVLGPLIIKKIMASDWTLFLGLVAMRMVNSLLIQTYFVPDEYWQSLEVAHNMVFDYGYMTWEWKTGLRGYAYPFLFAILFKIQQIFGLDSRILLIKLPRLLQGVIAACGDLYLYHLSWKLCGRATAQWTLLCQTISWFTLYCATRTLTNSTEAVLVTMALYYFPWPGYPGQSNIVKFLLLAATSVIVRPTSAVIWVLVCSWHFQLHKQKASRLIFQYIQIGVTVLASFAVLDRIFYGKWILIQYNFLYFNVISGGASFYGSHPWHWYLTQGFPVVMATHILPFVLGAWKARNKVLLFVIMWTIFIYSFLSHKEFRFLMPILPLCMHYCGVYFQSLCRRPYLKKKKPKKTLDFIPIDEELNESFNSSTSFSDSIDTQSISSQESAQQTDQTGLDPVKNTHKQEQSELGSKAEENGNPDEKCKKGDEDKTDVAKPVNECDEDKSDASEKVDNKSASQPEVDPEIVRTRKHKANLSKAKILVLILIITNVPIAVYFSLIHQRGTVVIMKYIYDVSLEKDTDVLFLMPCHSTPYYSYIHRNISMRFLTCEPNLERKENYTDEADIFYNDPVGWLKVEYSATARRWPSLVIYFNSLQAEIRPFLMQSGYRQCGMFFHSHLPEGRVGTHVIVSCR